MAKGSFVREIPYEFLGKGLTKFERRWGGKLTWHNVRDGDMLVTKGFHYWQLAAAFRPERLVAIPILHAQSVDDELNQLCSSRVLHKLRIIVADASVSYR